MQRRPFGSLATEVSVIGQGTWLIDGADHAAAADVLRQGLDLGMTHIDTAEMYGEAELVVARGDRGSPRRGFPGVEGVAEQRLARRHRQGLRALAGAARHRPARLLPAALARPAPAGRDDRGLRGAEGGRQDPVLGRQQFRRGRSRGGAGDRGAGRASPATRCSIIWKSGPSSTRSFRGARRTTSRWWPTARSGTTGFPARSRAADRCWRKSRRAWRYGAAGGAGIPDARGAGLCHPQGFQRPRMRPTMRRPVILS